MLFSFPHITDCGDLEILLEPGSSVTLTSNNYPSNYNDFTLCPWIITPDPLCSLYVEFDNFTLAREDYLYVGTTPDPERSNNGIRYTKDRIPPDLCWATTLYMTFLSDSTETDSGFSIRLTAVNNSNGKSTRYPGGRGGGRG